MVRCLNITQKRSNINQQSTGLEIFQCTDILSKPYFVGNKLKYFVNISSASDRLTDRYTNCRMLTLTANDRWPSTLQASRSFLLKHLWAKCFSWKLEARLSVFVSEPAPHHKSWRPSHQRHIKRIPKIQLCWNIWDLLKDLRHKQYVWSVPREVSRPLLKKRNSLTMFTTAIQKQLNCTRCWGGTGPDETPQAKWGQVQDQVSPRSQLRKRGGQGGCEGNKDSDIPVGPKLDTRTSSGKWTSPRRSSESQRTGVVSVLMTNRTKCFN